MNTNGLSISSQKNKNLKKQTKKPNTSTARSVNLQQGYAISFGSSKNGSGKTRQLHAKEKKKLDHSLILYTKIKTQNAKYTENNIFIVGG